MKKIVFLASGNGGTLKFTFFAIKKLGLNFEISAVIADRECGALEFAKKNNLQFEQIEYSRESPDSLQNVLKQYSPDIIVTNFHKIIDEGTLHLFPNSYINLHYSLLPAFGGLIGMNTIDAAKDANAQFIGATTHEVTTKVDAGKIISQSSFPVDWNNSDRNNLIQTLFKSACITFLNGLLDSELNAIVNRIEQTDVLFNPGIPFNVSELDDAFWTQVKNS